MSCETASYIFIFYLVVDSNSLISHAGVGSTGKYVLVCQVQRLRFNTNNMIHSLQPHPRELWVSIRTEDNASNFTLKLELNV